MDWSGPGMRTCTEYLTESRAALIRCLSQGLRHPTFCGCRAEVVVLGGVHQSSVLEHQWAGRDAAWGRAGEHDITGWWHNAGVL